MIVLDTHTLVWWVTGDPTLSKKAKTAITHEMAGGEIVVSAISAWEIAMLVERERLLLSMDVSSWLATVSAIEAVRFIPVDVEIATKSVDLPGEFHRDPADRMIVATARKFAVPLVTKDEKIRAYPHVKTIW
ncbi:type II toxin-antitoxin system VapC family toxin [Paraburkholderia aspalathi]|uniref:type II toxin-antitoxin system VapC family toxin n=1 Tax=Paraburkholderia aspalathi TaxID=1324617 RepID=UPI0038B8F157